MEEVKEEKVEEQPEMVTLKPNIACSDHEFDYISGTEVQCRKCPLGYGVTPETTVKDGHIYIKGELVI